MNTIIKQAPQILLTLIIIFFAALAILRMFNGIQGAFQEFGALDFYAYWYNGLSVRPGSQWAYSIAAWPVALTPLLILVMSLFSFLDWSLARIIWMTISISLLVATPWIAFYLLPVKLSFRLQLLTALMFYGFTGTSIGIRMGHPTMVTLFLMLLTLVFVQRGRKVLPGILLALALGKFNLSIPLLLYLIYKRNWSVVITGLGLQILGFLALALLVQVSPTTMIANYRGVAGMQAGAARINLTHLAAHFPHSANEFYVIGMAFSILVFGVLWWVVFRYKVKSPTTELWDYTFLAVLNLWGLLAAFHNQYDSGPSIFAIALLISAISHPNLWGLGSSRTKWLTAITVAGLIGIIVLPPGISYTQFLPLWAPIRWKMMTIGPLLLLVACIWLWRQGILRSGRET